MVDGHFPLSSKYDVAWAEENSFGENILHLTETLADVMTFTPGMRVLDLGCGHAISSIFLAREFGVKVWAVDLGIDPTENYHRIEQMKCADLVYPLRADVRALPVPYEYFDAVVALDSYRYFGTDERFLPLLARHLRRGGQFGIVEPCTSREISGTQDLPPAMRSVWRDGGWYLVHTAEWWRRHLARTELLDIVLTETVPAAEALRARYLDRFRDDPAEADFIALMESEEGTFTSTFRMVGQRTSVAPNLETDTDHPYLSRCPPGGGAVRSGGPWASPVRHDPCISFSDHQTVTGEKNLQRRGGVDTPQDLG